LSDRGLVPLSQEITFLGIDFWAVVQNVSLEVPWRSTGCKAFPMVNARKMQWF